MRAMSILDRGFLSPDITAYIAKLRAKHSEPFRLAEALSETAQMLMRGAKLPCNAPNADSTLLSATLFARATSTFQGVVLLIERGLTVEAKTLVRSCFENAACLSAITHLQEASVPKLYQGAQHEKLKLVDELLKPELLAFGEQTDEEIARLRMWRDELKGENPAKYSIYDMARDGQLDGLYVLYRNLSADAAHPGIGALERYYDPAENAGRRILKWGPEFASDELPSALVDACAFFMASITAANGMFGSVEIEERLTQHFRDYTLWLENRSGP